MSQQFVTWPGFVAPQPSRQAQMNPSFPPVSRQGKTARLHETYAWNLTYPWFAEMHDANIFYSGDRSEHALRDHILLSTENKSSCQKGKPVEKKM